MAFLGILAAVSLMVVAGIFASIILVSGADLPDSGDAWIGTAIGIVGLSLAIWGLVAVLGFAAN